MKPLKIIFPKSLMILLITLVVSGCSKDDDTMDLTEENYFLTTKIDGVDFTANSATPFVSNNANQTQIFTIVGINNDGGRITLTLPSPISLGAFNTDTDAFLSYVSTNVEIWGATENGTFGTITILNNTDDFVEGTFSFTGTNLQSGTTKEFTEGKFKAKKL